MKEITSTIHRCEETTERTLWSLEREDKLDDALAAYQRVEEELSSLDLRTDSPFYAEQQRVLAYCLMRQGNVLRQLGRPQESLALGEREIAAARASGHDVTLARSLMSAGVNHLVFEQAERGQQMLEEAHVVFARGDSRDHRQGLGWGWILRADLINGGLLPHESWVAVDACNTALEILKPIENWAGVARAYAARAQAREKMGDKAAASADREAQAEHERRSRMEEGRR